MISLLLALGLTTGLHADLVTDLSIAQRECATRLARDRFVRINQPTDLYTVVKAAEAVFPEVIVRCEWGPTFGVPRSGLQYAISRAADDVFDMPALINGASRNWLAERTTLLVMESVSRQPRLSFPTAEDLSIAAGVVTTTIRHTLPDGSSVNAAFTRATWPGTSLVFETIVFGDPDTLRRQTQTTYLGKLPGDVKVRGGTIVRPIALVDLLVIPPTLPKGAP